MQGAQLRKHIDATLGSGNLREAVRLPPGEDANEWLAVNSNLSLSLSQFPLHLSPSTLRFGKCMLLYYLFILLHCRVHLIDVLKVFCISNSLMVMPKMGSLGINSNPGLDFFQLSAVDFFNQVNLLYGTLTEFCTPENCPTMTAGPKYGSLKQLK